MASRKVASGIAIVKVRVRWAVGLSGALAAYSRTRPSEVALECLWHRHCRKVVVSRALLRRCPGGTSIPGSTWQRHWLKPSDKKGKRTQDIACRPSGEAKPQTLSRGQQSNASRAHADCENDCKIDIAGKISWHTAWTWSQFHDFPSSDPSVPASPVRSQSYPTLFVPIKDPRLCWALACLTKVRSTEH